MCYKVFCTGSHHWKTFERLWSTTATKQWSSSDSKAERVVINKGWARAGPEGQTVPSFFTFPASSPGISFYKKEMVLVKPRITQKHLLYSNFVSRRKERLKKGMEKGKEEGNGRKKIMEQTVSESVKATEKPLLPVLSYTYIHIDATSSQHLVYMCLLQAPLKWRELQGIIKAESILSCWHT